MFCDNSVISSFTDKDYFEFRTCHCVENKRFFFIFDLNPKQFSNYENAKFSLLRMESSLAAIMLTRLLGFIL